MSRLFISHSSRDDAWAMALQSWLMREGWAGEQDIFLDLDPERGIAAGERWVKTLEEAATRCEAVLFLVSAAWLGSKWCADEYQLANRLNKRLFALLIDDVPLDRLPGGLSAEWQVVHMTGEPAERFLITHPRTRVTTPVHISEAGLMRLKRGLTKAGIGPETFELQADPADPCGWRAPYRGLEALEPEDAAVFFGRSADIVRGIDAMRGLAARKPPRLLVILGASGAGKSSFLRAGLWPRLSRDDGQWLPLKSIRAGRGGAIEGGEGLLAALEEVHHRFALPISRAALRQRLATPQSFLALLREVREAAARRALSAALPLPVLCADQGEEFFGAAADAESETFLRLARAAIEADEALLLVTIRSDSYGLMQNAASLTGIDQVPISLGPVPAGEVGRVIREPAEVLRRKAGLATPVFDAATVERLQAEIEGEADALPLLAFALQRLMQEHTGLRTISVKELEQTGGVAAAIEREAEAALRDAGFAASADRDVKREALRRLFIPRLARIDRTSRTPQRRVARQGDLPAELLPLAHALVQRRLLVVKLDQAARAAGPAAASAEESAAGAATIEVAHEALLRRWPTLAELLAEDRDALLLLDGVLSAAADWDKAEKPLKQDYLAHRGSRLTDALALASRGADWAREIAPATAYLLACQEREAEERADKEAQLAREQQRLVEVATAQQRTARLQRRWLWALGATATVIVMSIGFGVWQYRTAQAELSAEQAESTRRKTELDRGQIKLITALSVAKRQGGDFDAAMRLAVHASHLAQRPRMGEGLPTRPVLTAAVWQSDWNLVLRGHLFSVESAAFSPDGKRIATTSTDRTARIWDAATGQQVATLSDHGDSVFRTAFSPDGSRFATASADKTTRVWNSTSMQQMLVLSGHSGFVLDVAFSRDGSRIATASVDKTARIWDAASGREIVVLRGHENFVASAAFSPNGATIVTASSDNTARVWNAVNGRELAVLRGHQDRVQSALFTQDGATIVTASDDRTIRLWDAATYKQTAVMTGHEAAVWFVALSPDGSRLVTASLDKTARVWDLASRKELKVLRGHVGGVKTATFSPDGSSVLTSSVDGTARIWSTLPAQRALIGHAGAVTAAASSRDGSRVATAAADMTARVWDPETARELAVFRGHQSTLTFVAFSPDGSRLATASLDKTAKIWSVSNAREVLSLAHPDEVWRAEFSADGTKVVTTAADNIVRIWDAATGREIGTLRGQSHPIRSAAFSPDGTRIVTGSEASTAEIWDVATASVVMVLRGHQNTVSAASYSADGQRIVTASGDGTARIWDSVSGQEVGILSGHDGWVEFAAFSPDRSLVVTASTDQLARVWDAASGQLIAALRGHEDRVRTASFHGDGSRIVTASFDKTARIWSAHGASMSTAALVAEACQRRLPGATKLSRDEMRLAGYADDEPVIDVCEARP